MMSKESLMDMATKPNNAPSDVIINGVRYCGVCKAPKEADIGGIMRPIKCKCAEAQEEEAKQRAKREQIEEMRERCLPRKKMRSSTFDKAEKVKHIDIASRYASKWEQVKNTGKGIVLWGNVGSGKSYAALCIANALIDNEIPVRYTTSADMVAELTEKGQNQKEYMKKLCSVPLLIVDDLGAEHDSGYNQAQLCRLIDARKDSGKPMVITTNYSLNEMQNPTDQNRARIFDRILSVCVPVQVVGESRRKRERVDALNEIANILELE